MLVEKERLASLGQMIGGIAHNLKTPIFSISGAAEGLHDLIQEYRESITDETVTIEDHLAIANDMDEWINKIKNYSAYMSDVITAVRGQAVAFADKSNEAFSIEELTKRVAILMKHELQQSLTSLTTSIQVNKDLEIKGNINSLVQVINNLISNAIQAYDGKPNNIIEFNIYKDNKNIIFSVKDYACGMSEEIQEKLFKEMITTKGKNGTGLGLFMSASNIKAQFNGDIKFISEVNKGTTFNVIIPVK
jgi:signal transduction histidine kinase